MQGTRNFAGRNPGRTRHRGSGQERRLLLSGYFCSYWPFFNTWITAIDPASCSIVLLILICLRMLRLCVFDGKLMGTTFSFVCHFINLTFRRLNMTAIHKNAFQPDPSLSLGRARELSLRYMYTSDFMADFALI